MWLWVYSLKLRPSLIISILFFIVYSCSFFPVAISFTCFPIPSPFPVILAGLSVRFFTIIFVCDLRQANGQEKSCREPLWVDTPTQGVVRVFSLEAKMQVKSGCLSYHQTNDTKLS